jgi:hypothetical protein
MNNDLIRLINEHQGVTLMISLSTRCPFTCGTETLGATWETIKGKRAMTIFVELRLQTFNLLA